MYIENSVGRATALLAVAAIAAVVTGCSGRDKSQNAAQPVATTVSTDQAANTIYVGGDIVTMSDAQPGVEALAVKDGRILAVGSRADIEKAHRGAATQTADLAGRTLLPGFIDAHSHYINSLLVANQAKLYAPPSGPGKDVESIIAELKKFAAERKIPKGELIMGYGYDDTVMPNGRLLNRDDLDAAFPDNPVRIDHVSMHGAVMNSLALKKYGISAATKTPPGGIIVRKPGTDEPWGLIMEMAFLPVMEQQEPMTPEQEVAWSRAGQMLYAEAGITTAHEGASHLAQYQTMRRAAEAGANIIDVVAPLDQMFMLWSAVNRISRSGESIGPEQRVTPLEGLKAMTIWVAEQYGEQDSKGSLEPGKLADLVILDRNPLEVAPDAIKDVKVVETIKEGKTIFRAP